MFTHGMIYSSTTMCNHNVSGQYIVLNQFFLKPQCVTTKCWYNILSSTNFFLKEDHLVVLGISELNVQSRAACTPDESWCSSETTSISTVTSLNGSAGKQWKDFNIKLPTELQN